MKQKKIKTNKKNKQFKGLKALRFFLFFLVLQTIVVLFFFILSLLNHFEIGFSWPWGEKKEAEIYQAIPRGGGDVEAYYQLKTDGVNLKEGDEFDIKILLKNTSQLDDGQGEGISSAEIELIFNDNQFEAIDMDPNRGGVQFQVGSLFSSYFNNEITLINNSQIRAYLNAYTMPGQTIYNSNNKSDDEMVFATLRLKVKSSSEESSLIYIQGYDTSTDFSSIYTNISEHTDWDIMNNSLDEGGGQLSLVLNVSPTNTPMPTNTPVPTATSTPIPKPDLIIEDILVQKKDPPETTCPSYYYYVYVKNVGEIQANKSTLQTNISPEQPQRIDSCSDYKMYSGSTSYIPNGYLVSGDYLPPQTQELYFDYFNCSEDVTVTIEASVDTYGEVNESNEDNNTMSKTFTLPKIFDNVTPIPISTNTPTPTNTPVPTVTSTPTPTNTPVPKPGECSNGLTIYHGDINKDCFINSSDWGKMESNWTSAADL